MTKVEKIARVLCVQHGRNPDDLEPGDWPCLDGRTLQGIPAHFSWREFCERAIEIIKAFK